MPYIKPRDRRKAIDFYRYYFLTQALHTQKTTRNPDNSPRPAAQAGRHTEPERRTFGKLGADDRWSSAGGRIYTTPWRRCRCNR
jgi:hypothetical protein